MWRVNWFYGIFSNESAILVFQHFVDIKISQILREINDGEFTIKLDYAQKFPWNQLFITFFSENVDLTEKCWFCENSWSRFIVLFIFLHCASANIAFTKNQKIPNFPHCVGFIHIFLSYLFTFFPDLFEALVELGNSGSQVVGQMSHPVPLFAQLGSLIIKCNQQLQEVWFEKFVYKFVSCLFTICLLFCRVPRKTRKLRKN